MDIGDQFIGTAIRVTQRMDLGQGELINGVLICLWSQLARRVYKAGRGLSRINFIAGVMGPSTASPCENFSDRGTPFRLRSICVDPSGV